MMFLCVCSVIGRGLCLRALMAIFLLTFLLGIAHGHEPSGSKPSEGAAPDIPQCLAAGRQAMEKGNLQEALQLLTACAQENPKSAIVHHSLGMLYFFSRNAEKATAEFKEALRLAPDNPHVISMLGRMYSFDPTKSAVAKELLERSLSINPSLEDTRFDLARVHAQQGDLEKCLKEFAVLFSAEQKFALYHVELAKILLAANQKTEARNQLQKALALAPDFEPAKRLLLDLEKEKAPGSGTSGDKTLEKK